MTSEKAFGRIVDSDYDIVSADDLLQLEADESWGIELAVACTCCSCTCHSLTGVVE